MVNQPPAPAVAFRAEEDGTDEATWAAWPPLQQAPVLDLTVERPARLVVLAAHPDDETLGAGGLIAACAAAGVPVDVVVATDGDRSHPHSPAHSPQRLAAIRRREVEHAVGLLAPTATLHLLGRRDGRLRADDVAVRLAMCELLARSASQSVRSTWLAAPWRGDGHPDHAAAGELAAELASELGARLLEYPIWAWHWARPGDERLPWSQLRAIRLDSEGEAVKARALAEHRSQIEPLSEAPGDEVLLRPSMMAHFTRAFEVFVDSADKRSLGAEFFDAFYAEHGPDPWGFTSRWYEQRKRTLTLASLPRERFRSGLEVGCSLGVLTAELAPRCDRLLALDVSATAVEQARNRTAAHRGVRVEQACVPAGWPEGERDLIMISEVGYYFSREDLTEVVERSVDSLADDGVLVLCHWRHPVADYPLGGDAVHGAFRAHRRLAVLAEHVEEDFRLDVLVPGPAISVARADGLLG